MVHISCTQRNAKCEPLSTSADYWSTTKSGGMWKKQLCDRTPARTHTVKSLRCAPICSADGCAALDRVRFVAGVKVSAPEGCQSSCLTRGMQGRRAIGPRKVLR